MSVESCFLTICNDLERRFAPKKSHFLDFWGGGKEKMKLCGCPVGFERKQYSAQVNSCSVT